MEHTQSMLPLAWFGVLGLILLLYTMLDGFDLGAGVLSLFLRSDEDRGIVMGSLGPIWDANETWIVLFGGIIFGAFPIVYGLVLSALYIPLVLMLVGLIFRAVSFEFRVHSLRKKFWGLAFGLSSLLAAVSQGFAFGGLMWGIHGDARGFSGGVFDWFNPFSIIVVIGVIGGYVTVGSAYLVMKTKGELQRLARRSGVYAAVLAAVCAGTASLLEISRYPFLKDKWFSSPGIFFTVIPIVLGAGAFVVMIYGFVNEKRHRYAFFSGLISAVFGYLALSANFYPVIVPPDLTIYQAAAPEYSQRVMLYAVLVALPIVFAYNILQYWIFRGKVETNIYEER